MNILKLRKISKLYFGYEELSRALGISTASARVTASRYVKMGLLVRIKRNLYMLKETWEASGPSEKFMLANLGQAPSYISLLTALDFHNVSNQMQQNYIESIALQRTRTITIEGTLFRYSKIAAHLYSGFTRQDGFFMSSPEKALVDAVYLVSFGRYALDFSAIDPEKINPHEIGKLSEPFPGRTKKMLKSYGYLKTT
jgi:predicted transcriptional regulator of viral defense system